MHALGSPQLTALRTLLVICVLGGQTPICLAGEDGGDNPASDPVFGTAARPASQPVGTTDQPAGRFIEPATPADPVTSLRSQGYEADHEDLEGFLEFHVRIWGEVKRPGLYAVPEGTSSLDLIALAGGPTSGAKINEVTLLRGGVSNGDQQVMQMDLRQLTEGKAEAVDVPLRAGDTILLDAKSTHRVLAWVGLITVSVLIADIVTRATR